MLTSLLVAVAAAISQPEPVAAIELREAWATPAAAGGDVVVYLTIANIGPVPFTVMETTSELTDSVIAVGLGARGPGGAPMKSAFAILPKKLLAMGPEGPFLRLKAVRKPVTVGQILFVKVRCHGGLELIFDVPVRESRPVTKVGREA